MLPALEEFIKKYNIVGIVEASTPAFFVKTGNIEITDELIELLRHSAVEHESARSRLCFHSSRNEDQKMLIYMRKQAVIKPFRQSVNRKLFIVLKGAIKVRIIEGESYEKTIGLGEDSNMCQINPTSLHEVIPVTDEVLFFEVF